MKLNQEKQIGHQSTEMSINETLNKTQLSCQTYNIWN